MISLSLYIYVYMYIYIYALLSLSLSIYIYIEREIYIYIYIYTGYPPFFDVTPFGIYKKAPALHAPPESPRNPCVACPLMSCTLTCLPPMYPSITKATKTHILNNNFATQRHCILWRSWRAASSSPGTST